MPSFFKHSNGNGIRKPRFTPHKHMLHAIPCTTSCSTFFTTSLFNTSFFTTSLFNTSLFTSVFDGQDCIWYYGTLYVKEATAVAKLQELNQSNKDQSNKDQSNKDQSNKDQSNQDLIQENGNGNQDQPNQDLIQENDDDDIESVSSSSCSGSGKRNVGKQTQLARLKDGMRLRHLIPLSSSSNNDEWFATFDAESNRIIRTPDGVAFDTLRQFARLHCNEVWGTTTVLTNVWSDPYFQYQGMDDDAWHPLSSLKK
jgi:hypothetical protein